MMQYVKIALAVEPQPDDAESLVRCLTVLGVEVRAAGSVAQAMELVRSEIFDLAIVAVELGLGHGSLLGRLSRLPAPRLVMASGPAGDSEAERFALHTGAVAYLARPPNPDVLAGYLALSGGSVWPGLARPRRTLYVSDALNDP